jgi:hypothetical protein
MNHDKADFSFCEVSIKTNSICNLSLFTIKHEYEYQFI